MRRSDICLYLGPDDRAELQALISNRNTPRKLVWRAEIVLSTADGQAPYPVKEIAVAGALGLAAGVMGRAYNVSQTGLNQYILTLAPTGAGKRQWPQGSTALSRR